MSATTLCKDDALYSIFNCFSAAFAQSRMLSVLTNLVTVNPATLALVAFGSSNGNLQVLAAGCFGTFGSAFNNNSLRNNQQSCQVFFYGFQDTVHGNHSFRKQR